MSPKDNYLPKSPNDYSEMAEIVWYRRQISKLQATIWVISGCWMVSCGFFVLWIVSRNS